MRKRYLVLIGFILLVFAWVQFFFLDQKSPYLEVAMLDTGQGDAILVTDPQGYQVLIDGGPDDRVIGQLEKVMPVFDRTLDLVMLSHPDADHVTGLSWVLDRYSVSTIIDNQVPKDTKEAEGFRARSNKEAGARQEFFGKGDSIQLPSGARLIGLSPYKELVDSEVNNHSIVVKLQYGKISFLFTGDIDSKIESLLTSAVPAEDLKSTVLKIPHHGSRYSSSLGFLKIVDPEFAIVSYGCKNSYGHPSPIAVRRYQYLHIPVYTTCDRGTFVLQTDGVNVWLKE